MVMAMVRVVASFLLKTLVMLVVVSFHLIQGAVLSVIPKSLRQYKDITVISGSVVVITGSANGLGRFLAERFARLNCQIALWDIDEEENKNTRDLVQQSNQGVKVITYKVDVTDRSQVYDAAQKVIQDFKRVDILVNNAGVAHPRDFLDISDEHIDRLMNVNAMGTIWTTKAFLPGMINQHSGHLVCVASAAGLSGLNKFTDYCASKHALVGFMESLAYELHAQGREYIHTTTVCPYTMDTEMLAGATTLYPSLFPILKASQVADRIIQAVLSNDRLLYIPRLTYVTIVIKHMIPVRAWWAMLDYLGMNHILDNVRGRRS